MSVAVVTASVSVIVAVLVFILNQWGQVRVERRQARLNRLNAQLRDLYGPLKTLADANEVIWRALRDAYLPASAKRRSGMPLMIEDDENWKVWITQALMPANRRMRDLILQNSHLLIETEMPEPLQSFCVHVAAFEVVLSQGRQSGGLMSRALVRHPGDRYISYLHDAYAMLKQEQARLLRVNV